MTRWITAICLTIAISFAPCIAQTAGATDPEIIDGFSITRTTTDDGGAFIRKTDTFTVADQRCRIDWVVSVPEKTNGAAEGLSLVTRFPYDGDCPRAFADQLPMHRAALKAVFAAWPKAAFSGYTCPLFSRMDPGGDWNVRIAEASSRSADYADFRRNYPHHKSQKHINSIFVEIVNAARVYRDLAVLFAEYGLDLTLDHVEKVFSDRVSATSFHKALKNRGLGDDQRVLYDAGIYNFTLKPR